MRTPRPLRDLGLAVVVFGLVFAVSYVSGRSFIPIEVEVLAQGDEPPIAEASATIDASRLPELHSRLDSIAHPASVAEVVGAVEGRFVIDHFEWDEWIDHGVPEGPPFDLEVGYTGEGATLRISARGLHEGVPSTERMTVILNAAGMAFSAQPGECTLELVSLEYIVLPGRLGMTGLPPERNMPKYTGQILCQDVADLRDGGTVSFAIVFDYDPEWHPRADH